ncbi:1421_t:CDS:1, partial [Funneliformis caledonium]
GDLFCQNGILISSRMKIVNFNGKHNIAECHEKFTPPPMDITS